MIKFSRWLLAGAALGLAGIGVALGDNSANAELPTSEVRPPASIGVFELARLLSQAPPDAVVVALDPARHPLRGALPVKVYGPDEAAFIENAPKARGIVLVSQDPIRADRIARRLMASGRSVRVLTGGISAWDGAMDRDPPAPHEKAGSDAWRRYRERVALRRAFGDPGSAPATPVAAPPPASFLPVARPAKKREGC